MSHALSRRDFLGAAAAGAGVLMAGCLAERTRPIVAGAAAEQAGWAPLRPAKIYKLYAGRTGDAYLTRPTEELARLDKYLAGLEQKLGDVKFIGGDMIPPAKVDEVVAKLADADALLIVHLSGHGGDAPVLTKLIGVGLPTALFSQPFSGHGWMYFPQWHKQGKKVMLMPTSNWSELDQVVALMRVPARLKQTRILAINGPNGTAAACSPEEVKKKFGADLVIVPNARVMEIFKSIDDKAAEAEAQEYWLGPTREIIEPKRSEIIDSARLFLATKKLMIEEKAQAVCSRACMGTPRGCFTFSKLNDLGLVGACEGDIDSTLTMLIFAYAFRVPGFITDPVIDTAKNAMVHFHCTSATKMDGPGGNRLPFRIRSQTDSKGGVAVEVENRVGQPVTCAKLVNLDTMLMVTGKIIETSRSPLACRNQFAQGVPNARRLFLNWGADVIKGDTMTLLHRAVFYGDHMQSIQTLASLMGYKVIEEGGPA